jgi:hypothetical protein
MNRPSSFARQSLAVVAGGLVLANAPAGAQTPATPPAAISCAEEAKIPDFVRTEEQGGSTYYVARQSVTIQGNPYIAAEIAGEKAKGDILYHAAGKKDGPVKGTMRGVETVGQCLDRNTGKAMVRLRVNKNNVSVQP